jgi:hypothetical protein
MVQEHPTKYVTRNCPKLKVRKKQANGALAQPYYY